MDLWPLGPEQMIITDPELAGQYITARNLPKHPLYAGFLNPILGEGNIVVTNGPRWKRLHNMLAPAFSTSHVAGMTKLIAQDIKLFHDVMSDIAESGKPFPLEEKVSALVFDIIYKAIYDHPSEAQIRGHGDLKALDSVIRTEMLVRNTWNPLTKMGLVQKREATARSLTDSIAAKVRARFKAIQESNIDVSEKRTLGILDLILRERIQESGSELDAEFIEIAVANIKTLLLAGSGTTTDTVCFTFMLISTHPQVISKLREEHRRVYSANVDETLSVLQNDPKRLNQLQYTTNVIKETLRIYPIGNTGRAPDVPGFVTYKGKEYPTLQHTVICPVQHTWHMDPSVFPNPDVFDPDRFDGMDKTTQLAWRPFERGTRQCLGSSLAMEEMKMILLLTVQYFDFECYGLKPNLVPRVPWTKMDLVYGDRAFQEFLTEARPRDGMMMTVAKTKAD